jgi:signal transduction histidine kinase
MHRAIALPARQFRRLRWNQDYVDVAMGVALAAVSLFSVWHDFDRLDIVSAPLLLLQTLPVAVRRRNPRRTLLVTGSATILYSLLAYPSSPAPLGVLISFYTVAAYVPRRRAAIAAMVMAVGVAISFAAYATFDSLADWPSALIETYLGCGLAWVIGDNLRVRRAYTAQLEERAVQLEREREEKAEQAVAQERARIARELHDVVAHHVSVMVVQAAGARRILEKDPAQARGALEAVEQAGRTALAEMRRMLEVLRAEDAGLGPQPGLADLERLAAQVREVGLPVELTIVGMDLPLPAGMDLAAYRLVQEALTNTVKHAGKATARVTVRHEPEALDIEVTDDGRGAAAPLLAGAAEGGHGQIGMRERVALYNGVLETGPVFPGGYRVHARFPLDPLTRAGCATTGEEAAAPSEGAAEGVRTRRDRQRMTGHSTEPEPMVAPRVVPPLIGRVVPPHQTPRSEDRQIPSTNRRAPSKTGRSEP